MTHKLHIADGLSFPIDVTTQALAWLGRRGSGKTYAATKLAELLYHAHAQFVALDPVGVWYGLRLAADGKGKGLEIPIFGGLHGDIPLEPTGGALLADVVVDRGVSAVIDVSQFESDAQKARFARDFGARFFFRKKAAPSAVHLFIEEAQEFVPQNPQAEETQMLHAYQRMVRLGRNYGIGVSLISQRPQEVNKKVLNQAECVFAFQLTGPHERKAVSDWVSDKGLDEDIAGVLPKLQVGCAHVWSPAWLEISKEVKVAEKWTYAAGTTPMVGAKPVEVKALAPVDLEQLHAAMRATIERAKAEDPKELRRRIAELEKQLRTKAPAAAAVTPTPVVDQRAARDLEKAWQAKEKEWQRELRAANAKLAKVAAVVGGDVAVSEPAVMPRASVAVSSNGKHEVAIPCPVLRRPIPAPRPSGSGDEQGVKGGGLRRMMIALAQRPQGLSARQLGVRAGLSSKSGTFGTYLGRARGEGWIDGDRNRLTITDAGLAALGEYEPLPTGPDLLAYWIGQLGESGDGRMLRVLADAYPNAMTKGALGEAAAISHGSGTFGTYLGKLRSLELVEGKNELRASEELFV